MRSCSRQIPLVDKKTQFIAINGFAAVCWVLFYYPPTFQMKHRSERMIKYVKNFDYMGAFFYTLGLLLFLMGMALLPSV